MTFDSLAELDPLFVDDVQMAAGHPFQYAARECGEKLEMALQYGHRRREVLSRSTVRFQPHIEPIKPSYLSKFLFTANQDEENPYLDNHNERGCTSRAIGSIDS